MSEETFSITAPFPDVASLAQGYVNRADGERLLLPLPQAFATGAIVRFMVHLVDGTPAFAGVGMCVQSSDQGPAVEPENRFETLLDSLRFDARSQPVYDYIVAVRASLYADSQPDEPQPEPEVHVGAVQSDAPAPAPEVDVDATAVRDVFAQNRQETVRPDGNSDRPRAESSPSIEPGTLEPGSGAYPRPSESGSVVARDPSFIPPPIPTGLLRRPARTMHWQPAPPRRPTPRPASGLFRYGLAGLPRPNRAPRPEIDASLWVRPAHRPA